MAGGYDVQALYPELSKALIPKSRDGWRATLEVMRTNDTRRLDAMWS